MDADVAELADATDLGSVTPRGVEVQILSSALSILDWQIVDSGAGPKSSVRTRKSSWARGLVGRRLLCTQEIAGSNPAWSTSGRLSVREGQRQLIAALRPTQKLSKASVDSNRPVAARVASTIHLLPMLET